MKNWYQQIRKQLEPIYGKDYPLFCDILAATSQRNSIKKNYNLAVRIYETWKAGNVDLSGMMQSIRNNVIRALNREPLSGRKITNFAANLKGDLTKVTVDTWMFKHFGLYNSPKHYSIIEKNIKREAIKHGLFPAQLQAQIWCDTIRQNGRKPYSYLDCTKQMKLF